MRNLFALLVGIDSYPDAVPSLNGCVNDINAFTTLLRERAAQDSFQLNLQSLTNSQASRQNVIDGFRQHLSRAGEDDVVIFYYSGHGSQSHTPPELWFLEPDHLDETLVCHDSRLPGNFDLADKELAVLIDGVASRNPHILVILDSCHSGSGTRAPLQSSDSKVRRMATETRVRPVESYLAPPYELRRALSDGVTNFTGRAGFRLPVGRHILMAACREDEEAKETAADGQARGVFSSCLAQCIEAMGTRFTYRDLFKRVNALVRIRAAKQSPLIETTDARDLDAEFLSGAIQTHKPYFTISFDKALGWVIDGGAVHGIPAPSAAETTLLAVFPIASQIDQQFDLAESIGGASVVDRLAARSKIDLKLTNGEPSEILTYKGVITSLPLPQLQVHITGDPTGIDLLRTALSSAGPQGNASLFVRESISTTDLRVIAKSDGYQIMRPADERALVVDVPGVTLESAALTIERLEHIARWKNVAELKNSATRLPEGSVKLEVYTVGLSGEEKSTDPLERDGELRFGYELAGDEWQPPTFKMQITNQSNRRLYFMLLDLPETFSIYSGLLAGHGQWLEPGSSAWATLDGSPLIPGIVPDELVNQGMTEIRDTLKLIASTEECDATLLDQPDLDVRFQPATDSGARGLSSSLGNLLRRVQTRHFGQSASSVGDWTTTQLTLTIAAPPKRIPIPNAGKAVSLSNAVRLLPHTGLKATARLTAEVTASRDPGLRPLPPLPPWLVDDPDLVRPFEFSSSRAGDAGLSVLELDDVDPESANTVSPLTPLKLHFDGFLGDNEYVLPVAYDDEFFLPLGWAQMTEGQVEINIERLPEPSQNKRSLTLSVRIFFKKVVSQKLGTDYTYPLLAIAGAADKNSIEYKTNLDVIRNSVATAQRILLYIHGIIGDTRGMAASAFSSGLAGTIPSANDSFDLVLTFDYENLNTAIEDTARDLKQRLASVGLDTDHGKELHIVAHSMGGLVARWFIEHEGGDRVVDHLVMLGTPNGGSPWPVVADWATSVIAIGLNGLSKIPWPPTVLGTLAKLTTKVGAAASKHAGSIEVALAEMSPDSEFLKKLNLTQDVAVRYSILAGNTSLVVAALESDNGQPNRIQRLFRKLNPGKLIDQSTTALAFFGSPNDIAVSVKAIGNVPRSLGGQPLIHELACDHLTYFSSEAGVNGLLNIMQENAKRVTVPDQVTGGLR
jgi:pimeloyl-ACP methyl ester carboxylesterase